MKGLLFLLVLAMSLLAWRYAISENNQPLEAPLFSNLGSFHHEISTASPLTQRFFDQGFVLFYGFEWGESIRSFKEAIRLDPQCGMCYWGLALALGDKINAPLTGHEYRDAQAAIQKALSLKAYETPAEQAYIQALSLRFQHAPKWSKRVGAFNCHRSGRKHIEATHKETLAYADAMKKVVARYPEDDDAKALYAYALFDVIDWDFWDVDGKINSMTPTILSVLKSALTDNPSAVGANHYYVHVIEQSPEP